MRAAGKRLRVGCESQSRLAVGSHGGAGESLVGFAGHLLPASTGPEKLCGPGRGGREPGGGAGGSAALSGPGGGGAGLGVGGAEQVSGGAGLRGSRSPGEQVSEALRRQVCGKIGFRW